MAAYKFERLIDESHVVELPPEVPKGWVEISVVPKDVSSAPSERYFAMLDDLLSRPARNRSNADIDAELAYLRER